MRLRISIHKCLGIVVIIRQNWLLYKLTRSSKSTVSNTQSIKRWGLIVSVGVQGLHCVSVDAKRVPTALSTLLISCGAAIRLKILSTSNKCVL